MHHDESLMSPVNNISSYARTVEFLLRLCTMRWITPSVCFFQPNNSWWISRCYIVSWLSTKLTVKGGDTKETTYGQRQIVGQSSVHQSVGMKRLKWMNEEGIDVERRSCYHGSGKWGPPLVCIPLTLLRSAGVQLRNNQTLGILLFSISSVFLDLSAVSHNFLSFASWSKKWLVRIVWTIYVVAYIKYIAFSWNTVNEIVINN